MNKNTRVTVIGGGIIGCAITYYLSKKGIDVTLIEKGEIVSGASGACQGSITTITFQSPLLEMIVESQELYQELKKKFDNDFECKKTGTLLLLDKEDQLPIVEAQADNLREKVTEVFLLNGKELRDIEPAIAKDVPGALYCPQDLTVNPIQFSLRLVNAAKEMGAKIYTYTEVENVKIQRNGNFTIVTNKGKLNSEYLINAAGAWSSIIGEMIGLKIPVIPRRGQLLVTEPIQPLIKTTLIEADYLTTAFDQYSMETSNNKRIRLGVAFTMNQFHEGNCLIGSSRDFVMYDRKNTIEAIRSIAKRSIRFIPKLKDINVIRTYAGLRPYVHDNLPILGEVPGIKGFIIATGHLGEGIMLAPITGKIISELIERNETSIPINQYSFERFNHAY